MAKKPQKMKRIYVESASQTAGPYVHIGLTPNYAGIKKIYDNDIGSHGIDTKSSSDQISISGIVIDGHGDTVCDALLEFSQADSKGGRSLEMISRNGTGFTGFNRIGVDLKTGVFKFKTLKPGHVSMPDGTLHAPHITVWIVARGINIGLHTRMYFDDEAAANSNDPVLNLIPKNRRNTLIARKIGNKKFEFNIKLQGAGETVFFDA